MFGEEPLQPHHGLEGFDCGVDALNDWLKQNALSEQGRSARTFLAFDGLDLVGYYALSAHLVERDQMPRSVARGSGYKIPSVLIAKLAVDVRHQGHGYGERVLLAAVNRCVDAARSAGARLIVVDATSPDAAAFYQHFDFRPATAERFYMKMSTAAKALGLPWP